MRYDGIECPMDRLHDLVALAADSLAVIDDERRRIRDSRAEAVGLAAALDAAVKESMRRRRARRTPGP
jgi:hypothetical protein